MEGCHWNLTLNYVTRAWNLVIGWISVSFPRSRNGWRVASSWNSMWKIIHLSPCKANLVEVCDMFYSKLCAQPTLDVYIEDLNMELVSHVPCKFSLVAQKVLEAPQQKRDILMWSKHSPKWTNGLMGGFFKAYWSFMSGHDCGEWISWVRPISKWSYMRSHRAFVLRRE